MGRPQSAAPLWGRASLKGGSGPGRCGKNGFLLESRTKGVVGRRSPLSEQKPQRVGIDVPPELPIASQSGGFVQQSAQQRDGEMRGGFVPHFCALGEGAAGGTGAGRAAGRGALIRPGRPGRGDFQRESEA